MADWSLELEITMLLATDLPFFGEIEMFCLDSRQTYQNKYF